MTPLLEVKDISKRFGGTLAVDAVSLQVSPGEIVGLIGPNGCGKSTLLNLITGFLPADSGTVVWDGQDVGRVPAFKRSRFGLVRSFQERMVFDGMTVRENLRFALIRSGVRKGWSDSIDAACQRVGIPTTSLDHKAADIPWGLTRLLGVGAALLLRPRMLLLDEPFAGVEHQAAHDISAALLKLRGEGMACLVVEHEMELLLPICDRVVVMAEGSVIATGTSEEILAHDAVRAAYFEGASDASS